MSTRASIKIMQTIIIENGSKKESHDHVVWLYHHHDGYPSFLGVTLWEWLNNKSNRTNHYVSSLATELVKHGVQYDNGEEIKMDDEYEIATDRHGDIDYLYEIKFPTITRRTVNGCYEHDKDAEDLRLSIYRVEEEDVLYKSGLITDFANVDWKKPLYNQ